MKHVRAVAITTTSVLVLGLTTWWWFIFKPENDAKLKKEADIEHVKTLVKSSLKDPDSAKFDDIKYFPETKAGCGYVNAKNSMGGYVGLTRFIASDSGDVSFEPPDDSPLTSAATRLEALQKKLDFLELSQARCPDGSEEKSPKKD